MAEVQGALILRTGAREERAYYCQNWRGDVVSILKHTGSTNAQVFETLRYSSYGVPFALPPGDTDSDGDCDNADGDAFLDWQINGPYTLRADIDLDGSVDGDDVNIAVTNNGRTLGRGVLSHSSVSNRKGYCGYEHDGVVDVLAHVRHRVLLTELGRWSRRDPLGYVDGMNALEYVRSNPLSSNDPTGESFMFPWGPPPISSPPKGPCRFLPLEEPITSPCYGSGSDDPPIQPPCTVRSARGSESSCEDGGTPGSHTSCGVIFRVCVICGPVGPTCQGLRLASWRSASSGCQQSGYTCDSLPEYTDPGFP